MIPDYSNDKTRVTIAKLGEFVYDSEISNKPSYRDVKKRPPFELDNGAIYIGEWNKDGLR